MLSPLDLSSLDGFGKSFVDLENVLWLASDFGFTSYSIMLQTQDGELTS